MCSRGHGLTEVMLDHGDPDGQEGYKCAVCEQELAGQCYACMLCQMWYCEACCFKIDSSSSRKAEEDKEGHDARKADLLVERLEANAELPRSTSPWANTSARATATGRPLPMSLSTKHSAGPHPTVQCTPGQGNVNRQASLPVGQRDTTAGR